MTQLDAYNEPHIEALSIALRSNTVAGLIGAGTSIASGYMGWIAFLDYLMAALAKEFPQTKLQAIRRRDVRLQLDDFADLLAGRYPVEFVRAFSPDGTGQVPPEWVRLIYDLPLRLLLTTNYTTELEVAARFHPSSPLGDNPSPVRWYNSEAMSRALRRSDGRLRLVYLHGRYDDDPTVRHDPENRYWSQVILGEKSYRFAYEEPGSIRRRIQALCETNTVLSIGCSLTDEDVKGAFRAVRATCGPGYPPHYAILSLTDDADPVDVAARNLDQFGVQPIFYRMLPNTASPHGNLEVVLRSLAARAEPPRYVIRAYAPDVAAPVGKRPNPRVVHPLLRALDFEPRLWYRQMIDSFLFRQDGGVLALVGIGGCGKTALVRDALDPILAGTSVCPGGLFVWSFYDEPNAAAFLRALANYTGVRIEDLSEASALDAARRGCRSANGVVIVLDGLERLQLERPDNPEIHGALESVALREFLVWCGQSSVGAKALITTRFPLPDFIGLPEDRVTAVDVDSLSRREARALLRRRGVNGTDPQLNEVLDYFGAHALTVDHLGGVIANYLGGDAPRFRELGEGPLTRFQTGRTGEKLRRIIAAYERYLHHAEPAVQATLQRVAVFPRAVSAEFLARVFLRPDRASRAGALAGKNISELKDCLKRLVVLRFLREERARGEVNYSIHPAVRDAILASLGDERRTMSRAAKEEMTLSLDIVAGQPGTRPTSHDALDFVEDLVGFCLEDHDFEGARSLYDNRLGGYDHLGTAAGQYDRGARITRLLVDHSERQFSWVRGVLGNDLAMYLMHVGRLPEATAILKNINGQAQKSLGLSGGLQNNLSEAEWLAGRIPASLAMLDTGQFRPPTERGMVARSLFGLGRYDEAFQIFAQKQGSAPGPAFTDLPSFYFLQALLTLGHSSQALDEAQLTLEEHRKRGWHISVARSLICCAEALRLLDRFDESADAISKVREWAMQADEKELLLWAQLIETRLATDTGQFVTASEVGSDGLRAAGVSGYGLLRIDFLTALAETARAEGDPTTARELADRARTLASEPACSYFWGVDASAHVLAANTRVSRVETARRDRYRADLSALFPRKTYIELEELRRAGQLLR